MKERRLANVVRLQLMISLDASCDASFSYVLTYFVLCANIVEGVMERPLHGSSKDGNSSCLGLLQFLLVSD